MEAKDGKSRIFGAIEVGRWKELGKQGSIIGGEVDLESMRKGTKVDNGNTSNGEDVETQQMEKMYWAIMVVTYNKPA